MAKRRASQKTPEAPETFETALDELHTIVAELEDGSIGLEASLDRFERGMQLLRHCHEVLETAEQRIEQLTGVDGEGRPLTEPFDASATIETRGESAGRRRPRTDRRATTEEDDGDPSESTLF